MVVMMVTVGEAATLPALDLRDVGADWLETGGGAERDVMKADPVFPEANQTHSTDSRRPAWML